MNYPWLRHYLARLHRRTLCYSLVRGNAETLDSIATALSQILGCPGSLMIHIIIQQRHQIILEVEARTEKATCPRCGQESCHLHQNHRYLARDLNISQLKRG